MRSGNGRSRAAGRLARRATRRADRSSISSTKVTRHCYEMAEATETRMRIFDQVREAARNWDGSDPIRLNWPQG